MSQGFVECTLKLLAWKIDSPTSPVIYANQKASLINKSMIKILEIFKTYLVAEYAENMLQSQIFAFYF